MNEMAEIAYNAYFFKLHGKLPESCQCSFFELDHHIKQAWESACHAVLKYATNPDNIEI